MALAVGIWPGSKHHLLNSQCVALCLDSSGAKQDTCLKLKWAVCLKVLHTNCKYVVYIHFKVNK